MHANGCPVKSDSLRPHGQAPPSMEFSKKEYWSGLLFPTPGDLPDPGIELGSLVAPALAGIYFTTGASWETLTKNLELLGLTLCMQFLAYKYLIYVTLYE